jgi:hypothetical protein
LRTGTRRSTNCNERPGHGRTEHRVRAYGAASVSVNQYLKSDCRGKVANLEYSESEPVETSSTARRIMRFRIERRRQWEGTHCRRCKRRRGPKRNLSQRDINSHVQHRRTELKLLYILRCTVERCLELVVLGCSKCPHAKRVLRDYIIFSLRLRRSHRLGGGPRNTPTNTGRALARLFETPTPLNEVDYLWLFEPPF